MAITRIGSGTSEADYEIDTSTDDNFNYKIHGDGVFYDLMDREQSFIVFNHSELIICLNPNVILVDEDSVQTETEEDLILQLIAAERDQRFEEARALANRIEAMKNKKAP
ncbi:MAG: hypothetical protein ABIO57_01470 [Candidatus Paceibacterota bacterium]